MTSSNSIKISIFSYGAWVGRYLKYFTNFHCCHALALIETLEYPNNYVGTQPFLAVLEAWSVECVSFSMVRKPPSPFLDPIPCIYMQSIGQHRVSLTLAKTLSFFMAFYLTSKPLSGFLQLLMILQPWYIFNGVAFSLSCKSTLTGHHKYRSYYSQLHS